MFSIVESANAMPPTWDSTFPPLSPLFDSVRDIASRLGQRTSWPSLQDYQALLRSAPLPVCNASGKALQCVAHRTRAERASSPYESTVFLTGELPTRTANWHDLFNVLAWTRYPRTKAALNRLHYEATVQRGEFPGRGRVRDKATLFDESGVAIACANLELEALLRQFRWKELFWRSREQIATQMKFFLIGHGLLEKAMHPFIGMTGQGIVLPVSQDWLAQPLETQTKAIDTLLQDRCSDAAAMSVERFDPVPLLGVPGFWPDNERESFYDNTDYFRPARR
jgi:hypothetical protein